MNNRNFHAKRFLLLASFGVAPPVFGQSAAPVTVTPPTLRPEHSDNGFRVAIPESGGLTAPAGAEGLSVTLKVAELEGGFAEVAAQTEAVMAKLRGQNVTLAQIYAAASEIEAIHARAGFVLARVAVPPQDLNDGGDLRITVIDGFVEAVDVSGIPARVRASVAARAAKLKDQRHVRLREIEAPLLVASDVPGLTLKSTLMRGNRPGGTKIVLEGTHKLVSGSIGGDNSLDPSLGRWGVTAQLSLNSAFGMGEQIYGFVSTGYDVSQILGSDVRERVLGGGIVLPVGDGRLTLNPEATFSRTRPLPAVSAPPTLGSLRRLTFRAAYIWARTRAQSLSFTGAVEQIDESNTVPSFAVTISHDRYMAARIGFTYDRTQSDGTYYGAAAQVSQGLGGLGAISQADALASGVPFSRQGSITNFTKLMGQVHGDLPVGHALDLGVSAKAQTSFGIALFRAEQFALEGPDAVSAYVGGATAVDDGIAVRAELGTHFSLGAGKANVRLAPYILAAAGAGTISEPTALERSSIKVSAFGLGARASLPVWRLSIGFEYAHGLSNLAAIDHSDRINFITALRF
jgi:hemolysin activation/secretion protein